jgi:GDPmannose 4,6-dehydratase
VGTGESHSVEEFVAEALAVLRETPGAQVPFSTVEEAVETDPRLLRTGEIHDLRADARHAREVLGWKPEVDFRTLVRMMVEADIEALRG